MKKFFLSMVVLAGLAATTQAQVHPHALGLRIGGGSNSSKGYELSYQHGLSSKNRIEMDLGVYNYVYSNRVALTGIYQWDWNLTGGLNWYIGPAATVSLNNYSNNTNGLGVAIGGQIGLEYDLNKQKLPLLISLDVRPMFDVVSDYKDSGYGIALGVRYTWGKASSKSKKK